MIASDAAGGTPRLAPDGSFCSPHALLPAAGDGSLASLHPDLAGACRYVRFLERNRFLAHQLGNDARSHSGEATRSLPRAAKPCNAPPWRP